MFSHAIIILFITFLFPNRFCILNHILLIPYTWTINYLSIYSYCSHGIEFQVIPDSPVTVVEQAVQTYDWGVSMKEIDVAAPVQIQAAASKNIETEKGPTMVSLFIIFKSIF